ncbi:hypothetical protein [Marinibactrum halimedae]|uniref:Uncharacterized protein n=1 Tax=Marinibactrum halimedae TaxID=1444977 RepID=A0AA37WKE0_9GAMM|nr:hypothetical protein [Marinibactrum halimedae]MCD9457753.1 hypothetical protein [Marinibactrum halimedae]GLS24873.1 hypothetical protein GCM10007877_05870 [Marinibactrum halimedae]
MLFSSLFLFVGQIHAFVGTSDPNQYSILFQYEEVANASGQANIRYPMCIPQEKQNTPEATRFLSEANKVANEWNAHTKAALGAEWPVERITFYTEVAEDDCRNKRHQLESGLTVHPVMINIHGGTVFNGGPFSLGPTESHFDNIERFYTIFLHEYGHTLGLADDYKGMSIQGGRPPSMMKMHEELQEEDKHALRFIWNKRKDPDNIQCPSTHFFIDDGYLNIFWGANAMSCLPYLKDNILGNAHLQEYQIEDPDNCVIFMDDPNADLSLFNGNKGDQARYREQNPEEYFTGSAIHPPICLDENNEGLIPISVLLTIDQANKADSLWVGKNIHTNIRFLKEQDNGRYHTVKEEHISYPFAWFDNLWFTYDQEVGREIPMHVDAMIVSIVDNKKEMTTPNIADVDEALSQQINTSSWPTPQIIEDIKANQTGSNCSALDITTSGIYAISRDTFSDQQVYCEVDDDGKKWTYLGYVSDTGIFKSVFHLQRGVSQVENPSHQGEHWLENENIYRYIMDLSRTDHYHASSLSGYSNGLSSKMEDNEMLIKVMDYHNGPKIYLKYEKDFSYFNDKYHRICEDNKTFDGLQLKIDWPNEDWAEFSNPAQWPDNQYFDAEISCPIRGLSEAQHIEFTYTDKTLGKNGVAFSFQQNLSYGLKLHNDEWTTRYPPEPLNALYARRNYQSWLFINDTEAVIYQPDNNDTPNDNDDNPDGDNNEPGDDQSGDNNPGTDQPADNNPGNDQPGDNDPVNDDGDTDSEDGDSDQGGNIPNDGDSDSSDTIDIRLSNFIINQLLNRSSGKQPVLHFGITVNSVSAKLYTMTIANSGDISESDNIQGAYLYYDRDKNGAIDINSSDEQISIEEFTAGNRELTFQLSEPLTLENGFSRFFIIYDMQ